MYHSRLFKSSSFTQRITIPGVAMLSVIFGTLLALACSGSSGNSLQTDDHQGFKTLEALVRNDPGTARDTILQHLDRLLACKADSQRAEKTRALELLSQIINLYTRSTGVRDLAARLSFLTKVDPETARQKQQIDSLFSSSSRTFSGIEGDSVEAAATRYLAILDSVGQAYAEIGDTLGRASVFRYRATALERIGLISDARYFAMVADSLAEIIGAPEISGDAHLLLGRIASIYGGNQFRADLHLQRALNLYRKIRRQDRIIYQLAYQAYTAYQRGSYELARHTYESALNIAQSESGPQMAVMQAYCMGQLAEIYFDLGEPDSAMVWCRRSLLLRESLNDRAQVAHALSTQGVILRSQGRTSAAFASFSRASHLFHEAGDSLGLLLNDGRLGELLLECAHYGRADSLFTNVIEYATKFESRYRALLGLGISALRQKNYGAARELLQECVFHNEELREGLPSIELRVGVLSDRTGAYFGLASMYLDEFRREEERAWIDSALSLMELAHARSLLEVNKDPQAKCRGEEELLSEISNLRVKSMYDTSGSAGHRERLRTMMDSLHILRIECGTARKSDGPKKQVSERKVTAETVMQHLRPDEAVFYYCTSPKVDWLVAFRSDGVSVFQLPVKADELERLVAAFRNSIDHYPEISEYQSDAHVSASKELYNATVPSDLDFSDLQTLYVIASGPLQGIPFAALIDSCGSYLTEHCAIVYPPSLTIALSRSKHSSTPRPDRTLVFANVAGSDISQFSQLPFADQELLVLQELLGSTVVTRTGRQATEHNFRAALKEPWDRVHLALHGLADRAAPSQSALVFAPERPDALPSMLNSDEIGAMNIDVTSVFLSACESGTGRVMGGEGVMSMARSFLLAGAKSVVASAWRVDDRASAEFASLYYRGIATGQSPRQALRAAQLHMIKSDRLLYRHPYFWASYLLHETNLLAPTRY